MDTAEEYWCSMEEITAHLGVSRDTVLVWIEHYNMPATRIGRLWKLRISDVDVWTESRETKNNQQFYLCGENRLLLGKRTILQYAQV